MSRSAEILRQKIINKHKFEIAIKGIKHFKKLQIWILKKLYYQQ